MKKEYRNFLRSLLIPNYLFVVAVFFILPLDTANAQGAAGTSCNSTHECYTVCHDPSGNHILYLTEPLPSLQAHLGHGDKLVLPGEAMSRENCVDPKLVLPPSEPPVDQTCPVNLGSSFSFKNPVTEVNRNGNEGHVYRFSDVLMGVDAKVTIIKTNNAYVDDIDTFNHDPAGYDDALQADIKATNTSDGDHYVDFKIDLLNAGTNTPHIFPSDVSYVVSALDVDGVGNPSKREYVGFKGSDHHYLETNTNLDIRQNDGYTEFITRDGQGLAGLTTSATSNIVTANYGNANTFYYRTGINFTNSNNQDKRFFSLYFDCITYDDPMEPLEPLTGNGTLRYANSGVGKYKDRILFMDWKDSALEDGIQEGDTVEFEIPAESCLANGKITATFSNIDDPGGIAAETKPHDMATWNGASFFQLYNTDGTGEALYTPHISPSNTSNHLGFTIDWAMEVNGQVRKPDILLIDAESTTEGSEQIDATTDGEYWSIIENALGSDYIVDGIGTQLINIKRTEVVNIDDNNPIQGWSPLMLSKEATTTSVTMRTLNNNGLEAVAFALLAPCDHGDAPATYGDAGHAFKEQPISAFKTELGLKFSPDTSFIGAKAPDSELNTQEDPNDSASALGDDIHKDAFDTARDDDEDIVIDALSLGKSIEISIPVTGDGYLQAWFDWNADGDFDDIGEQVANNLAAVLGAATFNVAVPTDANIGMTYARFRLSSEQNLASTGYAKDGEVEDVAFEIIEGGVCLIDDLSSQLYSTASVSANATYLHDSTRVFQAKFNNSDWSGQILSYDLKTTDKDGNVKSLKWNAANQMSRSGRQLFTYDPTEVLNRGQIFEWSNLNNQQQSTLKNGGSIDLGEKRLKWIKGKADDEGSLFRTRTNILGDIIHSNILFKGNLTNYGYQNLPEGSSYGAFLRNKQSTCSTLFVGVNDGMLHAFNADDGSELFAFIPNEIYPKLVTISDPNYGCKAKGCLKHEYLVDGTSSIGDAYFDSTSDWHSVLVGSLGKGGKGIFALDVTDPEHFSANDVLWEVSATQASSAGADASYFADHMGNSLPSASVARMNNSDATKRWAAIVGNGYESKNHQAVLFIIDVATGALIKAINTGVGTVDHPNGLSTPIAIDSNNDSVVDRIYAGDLWGNLWAFDVEGNDPANWNVDYGAPLFTASTTTNAQIITAPPQVGRNPAGGLMVYFGTGKYFDVGDNLFEGVKPAVNTYYGIHDNGSPVTKSSLLQQSILQESAAGTTGFNARVTSNHRVKFGTHHGWYMDLVSPTGQREQGERVISQALLRQGRLIFTTMTPPQNDCVWGGKSWLMEFDAVNGSRLDVIPFDTNDDKKFTVDDNVDYGGKATIMSGIQDPDLGVVFSTPAVITHDSRTEGKYLTGTGGNVGMFRESASRFSGRMSWRQLH